MVVDSLHTFIRKLNQAEQKDPVHQRELLAIIVSLRVWWHLLFGCDFQVSCAIGYRPIQHVLTQANVSPR